MVKDTGLGNLEVPLPADLSALQGELAETRHRLAEAEQALAASRARDVKNAPNIPDVPDAGDDVRIAATWAANERLYRAQFAQSALGMTRLSAVTGQYSLVNSAFCDLVGYSKNELANMTPADITYVGDQEADAAGIASILHGTTETYNPEKRYVHKDGSLIWARLSAAVLRDAQGNLEGTFAIIEDIRECKATEEALRQSEEFNRTVLESSPDCLKVIDADGRIEFVNGNGACLLELGDCTAVIGDKWETLWPASEHDIIRNALATALAGGTARFTAAAPTAKGTPKIWEVAVAPVPGIDGQPTRVIASSRDVTELRRGVERLRDSESRFRAAIEAVDGIVWTNNAVGEMCGVQPGWSALTGQTQAEYEGFGWSHAVHPDDAQPTIDAWNAAVAAKGLFDFEHRVRCQDGEWRHFSIRAVPTFDEANRIIEWVGVHRDITARKESEAHIQLLLREVNHRSKNMLAVVLAVAQQTGGTANAAFLTRFSERIRSLAEGQDLLVHSQWAGILLEDLVRAQLAHFRDLIGERITLAGDTLIISPEAAQTIGMALHELATNAAKYGALSNDRGRIAIAWQADGGFGPAGRFCMSWTEADGPPVVAPQQLGFGSTVIERMVKFSFDSDVITEFAKSGFSWRIECAVGKVIGAKLSDGSATTELT